MTADFPCPGCGRKCTAQSLEEGDVIFHEMPTCERYDKIQTVDDGTAFMREARLKELQKKN